MYLYLYTAVSGKLNTMLQKLFFTVYMYMYKYTVDCVNPEFPRKNT